MTYWKFYIKKVYLNLEQINLDLTCNTLIMTLKTKLCSILFSIRIVKTFPKLEGQLKLIMVSLEYFKFKHFQALKCFWMWVKHGFVTSAISFSCLHKLTILLKTVGLSVKLKLLLGREFPHYYTSIIAFWSRVWFNCQDLSPNEWDLNLPNFILSKLHESYFDRLSSHHGRLLITAVKTY